MKNKTTKKFAMILSLLLIVTMVAGCSSQSSDKNSTTGNVARPEPADLAGQITFSGYVSSANDEHLDSYIGAFNTHYNNVDVTVLHDDFMETYFAELDNRINDGIIGDVFLIDDERMAKYAAEGKILDLTPYVQQYTDFDTYETIKPSEELYKAAFEASLYDGKMYMGPTEYYHNFVFVNYSLLEEVGENVPSDQYSWLELLNDAKVIKSKKNIETPIVMDYSDYDIWGAFARSCGSEVYSNIGNSETMGMSLTDPGVISGFEYLANEVVSSGLVLKASADTIMAEDLHKYAFVVADHTNLVQWNEYLTSDKCGFDWDYIHFPGFTGDLIPKADYDKAVADGKSPFAVGDEVAALTIKENDEEQSYYSKLYRSNGAKTYGLAVYVYDDDEHTQDHYDMCAQLALYGLVDNGAEAYVGDGESVPANKAIASKRFWRDYPVSGKNSSVFTHYSDNIVLVSEEGSSSTKIADFSSELTSFLTLDAAAQVDVDKLLDDYLKNNISFKKSLQIVQDKINKEM